MYKFNQVLEQCTTQQMLHTSTIETGNVTNTSKYTMRQTIIKNMLSGFLEWRKRLSAVFAVIE